MAVEAGVAYLGVQYSPGDLAKIEAQTRAASSSWMGSWKRAAGLTAGFIGAAAIGKALFVDPLKSAGEFQRTMNVLQAQTGATRGEMDKLQATAIRLGADIRLPGTSASDAADAMLALSKGGLSVRDSMDAARGVLVASAAAQIDNAEAANIVANALNAFSLRGREAGHVADLLAGAANAATGDMPDFAQALQQAGTSAHALGVPIDDTVAALGELAKAGIQGSDAGTSLRTMFQRLIPSTKQAKSLVHEMGIDVFDSQGRFVGLRDAISQYAGALRKMTPEQRNAAIQTIFGSDAQRAANIILGQGVGAFDRMRGAVTKQGQAQKLAAAQNKGLAGAMDALSSTVETLQLRFGLFLAQGVEPVVRFLAAELPAAIDATIGAVTLIVSDISAAASVFGGFGGVLEEVTPALSAVFGFIGDHQAVFSALAQGVTLVAVAFGVWTAATIVATAAQVALGAALAVAFAPITIAVVSIGLLVGAIIYLYRNNETARQIITQAWAAIQAVVTTAVEAITATIKGLVSVGTALWRRFGTAITTIATNQFNAVRAVVQGVMTVIQGIINVVLGLIQGDWSRAWTGVKQIVSGALSVIRGILQGYVGIFLAAARALGAAILNGVRAGIGDLAGFIRGKIQAIPGALGDLSGLLYGAGQSIIQGLINGITSRASAVADAVSSIAGTITSHFPNSPAAKVGPLHYHRPEGMGAAVVSLLAGGISSRAPDLRRVVGGVAGDISGALSPAGLAHVPIRGGVALRSPAAAISGVQAGAARGVGEVRVFIGDRELTDIVRVEVHERAKQTARTIRAGRSR